MVWASGRITGFVNLQVSRTGQPLERGDNWETVNHTYFITGGFRGGVWATVWGLAGPSFRLSEGGQGWFWKPRQFSTAPAFLLWPHTLLPTSRSPLTLALSRLSAKASSDWQSLPREHAHLCFKNYGLWWTLLLKKVYFPSACVWAARIWEPPFCLEVSCCASKLGLWGRPWDVLIKEGPREPSALGSGIGTCPLYSWRKKKQWMWFFS